MLSKKQRLNIAAFKKKSQQPKKLFGNLLSLHVKDADDISLAAIITPKSLDKRSTRRNRTRRIIADAIQSKLSKIHKPSWILVRARKILLKREKGELENEMDELLRKAGII